MGPFMPVEQRLAFQDRAARDRGGRHHLRGRVERCFERACAVVAMGGYNTFCEILSFGKPALLVPRTEPRLEQYLRAERARALGLVRMLADDGVRAPRRMAERLRALPGCRCRPEQIGPRMLEGLERIAELVAPWLGAAASEGRRAAPAAATRRRRCRPPRRRPGQGLSAPVGDLHRPGDCWPWSGGAPAR